MARHVIDGADASGQIWTQLELPVATPEPEAVPVAELVTEGLEERLTRLEEEMARTGRMLAALKVLLERYEGEEPLPGLVLEQVTQQGRVSVGVTFRREDGQKERWSLILSRHSYPPWV